MESAFSVINNCLDSNGVEFAQGESKSSNANNSKILLPSGEGACLSEGPEA